MEKNWQDATAETIERFRHVLSLVPLTLEHRLSLYEQARLITQTMGINGARFWPVFLNTLRILVASESTEPIDREQLFNDGTSRRPKRKRNDDWTYGGRIR